MGWIRRRGLLVGRLVPWPLGSEAAHALPHSTSLTHPSMGDQEREKGHFTGFVAFQAPFFYPEEFFLPVLPS